MTNKIGIIGAGAWGTALASVVCRAGNDVVIQAREAEVVAAINKQHENTVFLPGVPLDASIRATTDLGEVVQADAILIVTPSQHFRASAQELAPIWNEGVPAIICSKGIEQESNLLMSEVAHEILPMAPACILSGPTFAREVALEMPTAVTLACADDKLSQSLTHRLATPHFRIYRSPDLIGAQIGGAVKNVLAIACGIVEGRKMGNNTRAALITRGLAEIVRLGLKLGASAETLMGLSGLGDLTLTCNAMQSRNFSLGVALGEGQSLTEITASRNSVAEGVFSASSVTALAETLRVEMPICMAINEVLNHQADIGSTIQGLLERPFKSES